LGITTTTPVSTSPAKPPTDCEPCTVCGRAVNGTKIVGKNFKTNENRNKRNHKFLKCMISGGTETAVNQFPWMGG